MGFLKSLGSGLTGAVGGFIAGGPVGAVIGGGLGLLGGNEQRRADDKSRRAARRADAQFRANLTEATGYQTGAVGTSTDLQLQSLMDAGRVDRNALRSGTRAQLRAADLSAGARREGIYGNRDAMMGAYGRQETLAGEEYDRTSGAYRPQLEMGRDALSRLNFLSGGGTAEEQASARAGFETSPGYTFRQEEGEKGIRRLANARGQLGSGAMYKDLLKYNQGLATDEYGNFVGQIQNVAGYLPAAARGMATAGSNYGGQLRGIEGARGAMLGQTALGISGVDAGLYETQGQLRAARTMGLAGSTSDQIRGTANLESNRALDIADLEANRLAGESNIMMNAYERKAAQAQQTAARRQGQIGQLQGMLGAGGGGGINQLMQMFGGFFGGGGGGAPQAAGGYGNAGYGYGGWSPTMAYA